MRLLLSQFATEPHNFCTSCTAPLLMTIKEIGNVGLGKFIMRLEVSKLFTKWPEKYYKQLFTTSDPGGK